MSTIIEELKYTEDHEWVKVNGEEAIIGITDYAQQSLGDITFTELPEVGEEFAKGDTIGTIESVKAASDLYMPISGNIVEINSILDDTPEILNEDPYEKGWMLKIKINNPDELSELLDITAYKKITE